MPALLQQHCQSKAWGWQRSSPPAQAPYSTPCRRASWLPPDTARPHPPHSHPTDANQCCSDPSFQQGTAPGLSAWPHQEVLQAPTISAPCAGLCAAVWSAWSWGQCQHWAQCSSPHMFSPIHCCGFWCYLFLLFLKRHKKMRRHKICLVSS